MTTKEIIENTAEKLKLEPTIIKEILEEFVLQIKSGFTKTDKIKIKNLGTFEMIKVEPRRMKSFGEVIEVKDVKYKIRFRASDNLIQTSNLEDLTELLKNL